MTTTPDQPRAGFTKGLHWTSAETTRCRGLNHSDSATVGTCDDCLKPVAKITHQGRIPHVVDLHLSTSGGCHYWCWAKAHQCDEVIRAAVLAERVTRLAGGEVMKGQQVRVVKGRKVPVGTAGTVTWVGEDGYGKARLGIRDAAGTIHWTAASNVEPITE